MIVNMQSLRPKSFTLCHRGARAACRGDLLRLRVIANVFCEAISSGSETYLNLERVLTKEEIAILQQVQDRLGKTPVVRNDTYYDYL